MDGLNDTYGRDKRCIQCFGGKPEGRYYLEDLRIDGRIILKWEIRNNMGWHGLDSPGSG
jgi:hypothetical protein